MEKTTNWTTLQEHKDKKIPWTIEVMTTTWSSKSMIKINKLPQSWQGDIVLALCIFLALISTLIVRKIKLT